MSKGLTASVLVCVAAAGVTVGALAIDAGGGDDGDGTATAGDPAGSEGATLVVEDFAFGPATVAPGQTVAVDNRDGAAHTATADDGAFDSGSVSPSATGSFTAPATPGTYQFGCSIHPQMRGTLTVQAAGGDTGAGAGDTAPPDTAPAPVETTAPPRTAPPDDGGGYGY